MPSEHLDRMDEVPLTVNSQNFLDDFTFSPCIVYTIIASELLISLAGLVVGVLFYSTSCTSVETSFPTSSSAIGIYVQMSLWFIHVSSHLYLKQKYTLLKYYGYQTFFHRSSIYRIGGAYVFSVGNAVLLPLVAILKDCFQLEIWITITIEVVLSLIFSSCLLYKTQQFIKQRNPPDIQLDEQFLVVSDIQPILEPCGVRCPSRVEDLLERQADLIYYQHQHIRFLGEKILALASRR